MVRSAASAAAGGIARARPLALGRLFDGCAVDCARDGWRDLEIDGLSLDSRQVEPGDLYLALPGRSTHGLDHAADALARGAVAIAMAAGDARRAELAADAALLAVDGLDLADAARLADRLFDSPGERLRLVAVTGTDGKTSVCRFVAEAFVRLGQPTGYIGTLGWGLARASGDGVEGVGAELAATALTTPDAIALRRMLADLARRGAVTVALEASSHGLAEGRLDGLAIDVAVLTNLGRDHLDYHGSEAAYAEAKSRLFDWPTLGARVLNVDDALGRRLLTRGSGAIAAFAIEADVGAHARADAPEPGAAAAVPALRFEHRLSAVEARIDGLGFTVEERVHGEAGPLRARGRVDSALYGRFNAQNLAACLGVLRLSGIDFDAALATLCKLAPVPGRMQRVALDELDQRAAAPAVLVDYAHTPAALAAAIEAVRAHCPGALTVVFGCGGDRDPGKRAPMARSARAADRIVVTDDNPRHEDPDAIVAMILQGFEPGDPVTVIRDRAEAIAHALGQAGAHDVVLIAGKGHENYQIAGDTRLEFDDREVARGAWLARPPAASVAGAPRAPEPARGGA